VSLAATTVFLQDLKLLFGVHRSPLTIGLWMQAGVTSFNIDFCLREDDNFTFYCKLPKLHSFL
jgi:hypothetical protein